MLDEEKEFRKKERKKGYMLFIAELYKHNMLPHDIVKSVISDMLYVEDNQIPPSENIEVVLSFLTSIGKLIDQNHKSDLDDIIK